MVSAETEGAFLVCSFWLADAYVMLGRVDDATELFERVFGGPQRSRTTRRGV